MRSFAMKPSIAPQAVLGFITITLAATFAVQAQQPRDTANTQGENIVDAADKGDLSRVKALLDSKVDINFRRANGATALMVASEHGHLAIVQALLDAHAD